MSCDTTNRRGVILQIVTHDPVFNSNPLPCIKSSSSCFIFHFIICPITRCTILSKSSKLGLNITHRFVQILQPCTSHLPLYLLASSTSSSCCASMPVILIEFTSAHCQTKKHSHPPYLHLSLSGYFAPHFDKSSPSLSISCPSLTHFVGWIFVTPKFCWTS